MIMSHSDDSVTSHLAESSVLQLPSTAQLIISQPRLTLFSHCKGTLKRRRSPHRHHVVTELTLSRLIMNSWRRKGTTRATETRAIELILNMLLQ